MEMGTFWCTAGPSIEVLTLNCGYQSKDALDIASIKKFCRKVRRLRIRIERGREEELAGLYASYGAQLEFVYVFDMPSLELEHVKSSCPKAHFDAEVRQDAFLLTTVRVLASQLVSLTYHSESRGYRISNLTALASAFNSCSELRDLDLKYCSLKLAEAICTKPKPNIDTFIIGTVSNMPKREQTQMVELFRKGTGPLSFFGFRGLESELKNFSPFITHHRKTLREACFFFTDNDSCASLLPILHEFLDCPELEKVSSNRFSRHLVNPLARHSVFCYGISGKYYYQEVAARPHWTCILCRFGPFLLRR